MRQCEQLLIYINKIHKNITLITKYENTNSVNFIELSVTKLEHRHTFSKYRKPTNLLQMQTDIKIPLITP